jgi:hypothetical protein
MLLAMIAGCEIGFWVVLLAGLSARYLLGLRRVGAVLLAGVPLVDLVLLIAAILHLRSGATADFTHGLAAVSIQVLADPRPVAGTVGSTASSACIVPER